MKVLILSECPGLVTSLGKVSLYIASGLREAGFEVYVVPYSFSVLPSLMSTGKVLNPCVNARENGDPLADLFPCSEIYVYPWNRLYPISELDIVFKSDVLIVYSYPYVEHDLNDIAYKFFTSRGKPSIIYALHEGPFLDPDATLSVLAHSFVIGPTRTIMEQYLRGLATALGVSVESLSPYFSTLRHPLNVNMYRKEVADSLVERYGYGIRRGDYIVGLIAKNHIRKDYLALVEAVMRARMQTGLDIVAGLYWIDVVSGTYWKRENIVKTVARKLQIDIREVDENIVMMPDRYRALGLSESELIHFYVYYMDMHLFLTRGEAYGLPPVESSLLGVPTATTDIPVQRDIFGDGIRYVKTGLWERDDFTIYKVDPVDASQAIVEFTEGKLPAPDTDFLRREHDYRNIVSKLIKVIDAASQSPRALSEKLSTKRGAIRV